MKPATDEIRTSAKPRRGYMQRVSSEGRTVYDVKCAGEMNISAKPRRGYTQRLASSEGGTVYDVKCCWRDEHKC